MKRFILIFCATFCSAVVLSGCGGGGDGGTALPMTPVATAKTATTKMFLFGTMSSASAGGSAGILDSINTTISALPAGVALTSIVPSGTPTVLNTDVSTGFNSGNLTISLLNTDKVNIKADTTSNGGKGIEVATLNFSVTGTATPPIPTPGTDTTVQQYRIDSSGASVKELTGCIINFETTYY